MNRFTTNLVPALLLLLASATFAGDPVPQIRATGEARAEVAPDMALLQLTVTREAETARAALDASSAAMAEVIAAMREGGVAERDLQTSNFSIQPRYVYPKPREEQPPRIVGYIVSNSLTVRVRELENLGALLDRSVTLGVNEGGGVQFTNADPSAALAQARAEAVRDAMRRAKTMAEAAGVKLGDVLQISEQTFDAGPRPVFAARAMAMEAADAVPIQAGENTYRVVVQASIAIEQ